MYGFLPLFDRNAARALDRRATALLGGDGYVLMQRAGQAVSQHIQATHFGSPFSRTVRRWRLRWRTGSGFGSSGNWTVGMALWLKRFFQK